MKNKGFMSVVEKNVEGIGSTLTSKVKRSIIRNEGDVWVMRFGKSIIRFFKTLVHTITKKFGGKIPFSIKKFFSRYLGGKVPMKSRNTSIGRRFAATFSVALITIVLVACGGGGGAPAVPLVVVVPPVANFVCWNSVKATNKDTCPIVTAPTVTLNSANLPVITFAPGATATGGTLTAAAGASTVVYTVQPNGTVILVSGTQSFSALYTYTLTVNYSNGPSQTVAGTYTTGTAPVVVTPIGVYLFNPAILPFEPGTTVSPAIGSATWNATNPPTFETGMIITGLSNVTPKALLGKFFISPSSGAVCTTLVYKDTGLSIYTDPRTYGGCKSVPFDRVMGTPDGYIMYYPSIGRCEKVTWSIATVSFKSEEVICP